MLGTTGKKNPAARAEELAGVQVEQPEAAWAPGPRSSRKLASIPKGWGGGNEGFMQGSHVRPANFASAFQALFCGIPTEMLKRGRSSAQEVAGTQGPWEGIQCVVRRRQAQGATMRLDGERGIQEASWASRLGDQVPGREDGSSQGTHEGMMGRAYYLGCPAGYWGLGLQGVH